MDQPKRTLLLRRVTGCALVFVATGSICVLIWSVVAIVHEAPGVEEPVTVIETSVAVDTRHFPADLVPRDWYDLSGRILRERGWTGSLGLTHMTFYLRCSSDPEAPILDSVELIVVDGYLDAIVPSVREGVLFYELDKGTASVDVCDSKLSLPGRKVNPAKVKVEWRDAFQAGQRLGGTAFYQAVGGQCLVRVWLRDGSWSIRYRDEREGQHNQWAKFEVVVDATTGKASRRSAP